MSIRIRRTTLAIAGLAATLALATDCTDSASAVDLDAPLSSHTEEVEVTGRGGPIAPLPTAPVTAPAAVSPGVPVIRDEATPAPVEGAADVNAAEDFRSDPESHPAPAAEAVPPIEGAADVNAADDFPLVTDCPREDPESCTQPVTEGGAADVNAAEDFRSDPESHPARPTN
jgi:hypothetical protein